MVLCSYPNTFPHKSMSEVFSPSPCFLQSSFLWLIFFYTDSLNNRLFLILILIQHRIIAKLIFKGHNLSDQHCEDTIRHEVSQRKYFPGKVRVSFSILTLCVNPRQRPTNFHIGTCGSQQNVQPHQNLWLGLKAHFRAEMWLFLDKD